MDFELTKEEGSRHLGGFIGSNTHLDEWLAPKIEEWAAAAAFALARIVKREPQCACAGLTKPLQSEWSCLHCVLSHCEDRFQLIEDAIHTVFLPIIFDGAETNNELRELTTLIVKHSGLGVPNPQS